jgi:thiol:disulfide interchange protein
MLTAASASTLRRCSIAAAAVAALLSGSLARAEDIGYDAKANPFDELTSAVKRAGAEHKLVLLIAGGDWCIWCHYLHAFLDRNADLDTALHEVFVVQQVYSGDDNRNEPFFATLPKAGGYPHFWIIGARGEVLKSQRTDVLEDGDKSYDHAAFARFIAGWQERAR